MEAARLANLRLLFIRCLPSYLQSSSYLRISELAFVAYMRLQQHLTPNRWSTGIRRAHQNFFRNR